MRGTGRTGQAGYGCSVAEQLHRWWRVSARVHFYERVIDPTNETQRESIRNELCALNAAYSVDLEPLTGNGGDSTAKIRDTCKPDQRGKPVGCNGIVYRRELPYVLTVLDETDPSNSARLRSLLLNLPNRSPVEILQISAGLFSSSTFSFEFENGLLTRYVDDRPSELLRFVAVPFEIAKALISIPAEILSLKINLNSQNAALVETQAALLESQAKLEAAERGEFSLDSEGPGGMTESDGE